MLVEMPGAMRVDFLIAPPKSRNSWLLLDAAVDFSLYSGCGWTYFPRASPQEQICELQEALLNSESARQELFDFFMQSPDPMVILLGAEHRFALVNPPYRRFVAREVIGKAVAEVFTDQEIGHFILPLDQVYQTGVPFIGREMELTIPDEQGVVRTRYIHVDYHPFRQADGIVKGVLAFHRDVTDQVLARREVEESETRYALATGATRDTIWDWNILTNQVSCNEAIQSEHGYDFRNFNIDWWLEKIHDDDRERVDQSIWRVIDEGGSDWSDEYRFQSADGRYKIMHDRGKVVRDIQGAAIRMIGAMEDVSTQRIAEDNRRKSEQQLKSIFNQTIVGMAEMDRQGKFILVNDEYCRMVGRSREELLRIKMQDITHPDDLPNNLIQWKKLVEANVSFVIEKRYLLPNQSIIWVHNSVSLIDGQFVVAVSTDITERKLNEEERQVILAREKRALLEAKRDRECLHTLFTRAPAAIAVCILQDDEFVFELANTQFETLVSKTQLQNKRLEHVFPVWKREHPGLYTALQDVAKNGKRYAFTELPILLHCPVMGVKENYFNVVYETVRDLDGRPHGFMAFGFDVTSAVLARRAIEKSEARFRSLSDTIPNLVWISNRRGSVTFFNRSWFAYTGLTWEESRTGGWKATIHPADFESSLLKWTQALKSGQPLEHENRIRRGSDGMYRWHLVRALPIMNSSGEVTEWFGTLTDIQEQKEISERLEVLCEDLKAAVQARNEFLSIASHELKTPITSLKMQLQMARKNVKPLENLAPSPERLAKVLDLSIRQVDRLNSLIEALLDVSRIEAGKMHYNFEAVDLAAILEEVLERFSEQFKAVNCPVKMKAPGNLRVVCDRFRIEQVITNLITNAMKYGQGSLIEVSLAETPTGVRISVADQGMGIAPEKQALVFDRFERAVSHVNISGLGLGLYIIKQIVSAHGGEIRLQSELGRGSTFIVELPFLPCPTACATEKIPEEKVKSKEVSCGI